MKSKKELVDLFLGHNDLPKYIFGTNPHGKKVADRVGGVVFIDEFSKNDTYEGYPVVHDLQDVPKDALVLNCVACHYPVTVRKKLEAVGITNVDVHSLIKYSDIKLSFSPFWDGFDESYAQHRDEYDRLENMLSDEKSKDTYRRLIEVRANHNLDAMMIFKDDEKNQYFEDFLDLKEVGETFVDVGGFDGYTSLEFIKRCPNYEKVYFFEPEPAIMELAKKNLAGNDRIEYCQYAASNKKDTLHFASNNSGSHISDNGEIEVFAEKIDSLIHSKVTFIKMDIEGAESLAIEGAKETILKYHPRLAICVYHKGGDYVDIPRQVLAIRDDYNLYMRHYTEGMTETVMFFMPKK